MWYYITGLNCIASIWPGVNKIVESTVKKRPPNAGKGRPKGSKNKTTALLKDAILQAAEEAGDKEGMVGYLKEQALKNPTAFMGLLGRVLPIQHTGEVGAEIKAVTVVERRLVSPKPQKESTL
jgi:hypothetical protein